MKLKASFTLFTLSLLTLSGCSWIGGEKGYFRDRGNDYLKAEQGQPMQLPAGVHTRRLDPLMPIPYNIQGQPPANYQVPAPSVAEQEVIVADEYTVHKSGQTQWLVAQRIPAQLWNRVIDYYVSQGFEISDERPQQGEFETNWQTVSQLSPVLAARFGEANQQLNAKLLVRIEPGVQRNSSEIFITASARQADQLQASQAANGALEAQLLEALRNYLSQDTDESFSLIAANRQFDTPDKVVITHELGEPVMLLDTSFDRAWSSVGRAIEQAGISIEDLNRSASQYEINLAAAPKTQKRGWFKRTFTKDPAKIEPQLYTVKLQPNARQIEVRILQGDQPAHSDQANKILQRIKASLN